jgi:hypothetical protein
MIREIHVHPDAIAHLRRGEVPMVGPLSWQRKDITLHGVWVECRSTETVVVSDYTRRESGHPAALLDAIDVELANTRVILVGAGNCARRPRRSSGPPTMPVKQRAAIEQAIAGAQAILGLPIRLRLAFDRAGDPFICIGRTRGRSLGIAWGDAEWDGRLGAQPPGGRWDDPLAIADGVLRQINRACARRSPRLWRARFGGHE